VRGTTAKAIRRRQKAEGETTKCPAKVKNDFRVFLFMVWKHLNLPDPTRVQYDIAKYLQHGPKRSIIQGFRGVGKSWITAAYVCWRLLLNPQEKILVVSASKQRSDDFSTFTLKLIKEIPILKHLAPRPDQRESKISFDVAPAQAAQAPSVKAAGIFGMITGSRATLVIADDVEIAQNALTQDMRDKLIKAVAEFEAIIVPEGHSRIVFLGTPQTEESIYKALRLKQYESAIWPARYPTLASIQDPFNDPYKGGLAPMLVLELEKDPDLAGKPTDPQRFNDTDLIEREASYGRSGFTLQFMLDTTLSDADRFPLRTSDIIVAQFMDLKAPVGIQYGSAKEQQIADIPRIGFRGDRWHRPLFFDKDTWQEFQGVLLSVDPSGRGGDETGYAVTAHLHGKIFVLAAGGLKGGYDEFVLVKLAKLAKRYAVNEVLIESNFGDGMFASILKPVLARIHPCAVEEVRHNIQKERRIIDTLEPVLNSHRLVVHEDVVRDDLGRLTSSVSGDGIVEEAGGVMFSLFYQMTRITKDRGSLRHDDRLDALSIGVAYWVECMARDERKSEEDHKAELLDIELENFMEGILGTKPSNRWISLTGRD
jgi:hypothetical protein